MYSITLALFVTTAGLIYHTLFILAPADLMNKRIPAIVAVLSWFLLGVASGALVPVTYTIWNDYIISTIAGICFVLGGATLGHIILSLSRRQAQNDVSFIAKSLYREDSEENN
jgi:hypothetical protein